MICSSQWDHIGKRYFKIILFCGSHPRSKLRGIQIKIKHLLAQGVQIPLKKKWITKGFGGTQWNDRETDAINFDAGFDYLSRCRVLNIIDAETFEITEYFDNFAPKYHTPPSLPIQINRQIENEAENIQHCYYWLYIFENTLRDFIQKSLSERYGENWRDELSQSVKKEIKRNQDRWHGGIPPRNPLEFSLLPTLHTIIMNKWKNVFKDKFENTNPASLKESLNRIEEFRNTIAHNCMLTEEESKVFYYEINRVLPSLKIFRK